MKYYAFIFARKGSKRLKNKNLKIIGGKSLLAHSIEIAKKIKQIKKIFVSSDDKRILNIAKQYECIPILRPNNLAKDDSPEWLSWRHAINFVKKLEKDENFNFISLPTTSPLKTKENVRKCIRIFNKNKYDTLFTISKTNLNPNYNMVFKNRGKFFFNKKLKNKLNFRSKFQQSYFISTLLFIAKPNFIKKKKSLFDGKFKLVEFDPISSIDIDTELDLKLAKIMYEKKY